MRAQEFTEGYNEIDDRIHIILAKKGYKKLGQGVDQAAYLEPGGRTVLKVFGADIEASTKFSSSHRMFFTWAKYCMANPDNPFLAKFDDYESFIFNNRRYLQIRQELLKSLPNEIFLQINALYSHTVYGNKRTVKAAMQSAEKFPGVGKREVDLIKKLVDRLGEEAKNVLSC